MMDSKPNPSSRLLVTTHRRIPVFLIEACSQCYFDRDWLKEDWQRFRHDKVLPGWLSVYRTSLDNYRLLLEINVTHVLISYWGKQNKRLGSKNVWSVITGMHHLPGPFLLGFQSNWTRAAKENWCLFYYYYHFFYFHMNVTNSFYMATPNNTIPASLWYWPGRRVTYTTTAARPSARSHLIASRV